jgi:elongation factor G
MSSSSLRVTLTDGATHPKDSSALAFRTAGRLGLQEALRASVMQFLEPVAEVAVTVPGDAVGGVLGDIAARRGHIVDSARPHRRLGGAGLDRRCHHYRAAG